MDQVMKRLRAIWAALRRLDELLKALDDRTSSLEGVVYGADFLPCNRLASASPSSQVPEGSETEAPKGSS